MAMHERMKHREREKPEIFELIRYVQCNTTVWNLNLNSKLAAFQASRGNENVQSWPYQICRESGNDKILTYWFGLYLHFSFYPNFSALKSCHLIDSCYCQKVDLKCANVQFNFIQSLVRTVLLIYFVRSVKYHKYTRLKYMQ